MFLSDKKKERERIKTFTLIHFMRTFPLRGISNEILLLLRHYRKKIQFFQPTMTQ